MDRALEQISVPDHTMLGQASLQLSFLHHFAQKAEAVTQCTFKCSFTVPSNIQTVELGLKMKHNHNFSTDFEMHNFLI